MRMTLRTQIILAGLLSTTATLAFGGPNPPTNILYGFISSSRTLTYAYPGPIYHVIGDLIVQPGVTLTVDPGVMVSFAARDTLQGGEYPDRVEMDVLGTLTAQGAIGDSIYFLSEDANAGWGQIKVENGANLNLRYVSMKGPIRALGLYGSGTRVVDEIGVSNCVIGLDTYNVTAPVVLRRSNFSGRSSSSGAGLMLSSYVSTTPPDTLNVEPTLVDHFSTGVTYYGGVVRNVLVRDCYYGFNTSGGLAVYCTAVRNTYGFSGGNALNCIAAMGGYGFAVNLGDYLDSWNNGLNYYYGQYGSYTASFSPFFVDPDGNDFRLGPGSIFKSYGPHGEEIGTYGPGPGTPVHAQSGTWGHLKAMYR